MTFRAHIDPLRLAAAAVPYLPVVVLPIFGVVWLIEKRALGTWVIALLACAAVGALGTIWLSRRKRQMLALPPTEPEASWRPREFDAWGKVDALAHAIDSKDWPLSDLPKLIDLGRHVIDVVAKHYHPADSERIWQMSIPHLLRIIELAARDLGRDVRENLPLSDRITVGDVMQVSRWKPFIDSAFVLIRVGRAIANPTNAVYREVESALKDQATAVGRAELHRSLLQEYVRRVGRYSIDLYSGTLRFADDDPLRRLTAVTATDLEAVEAVEAEPLRILVLGRTNAGKSSLLNALFGDFVAAADILPTTNRLTPYVLERDGAGRLLVTDSPGLETLPLETLRSAARDTDMILWVCPAHRADRAADRTALDAIRADLTADPSRRAPPIVVALSHIDQLRPIGEWSPPYDLRDESNAKSQSTYAALAAVARDIGIDPELIVPVCLEPKRLYNVDDALWATMLSTLDEARRVRLLRCLDSAKRDEKRALLRSQLLSAGRLLFKVPSYVAQSVSQRLGS